MTTEGWKEAAPLQRKLRFSVQVNIYLKPCICLKYENVNIENDSATGKTFLNFWNLAFRNEKLTEIELTSPLQNIPPPHPTPPIIGQPTHKSKNILTSFKNTKFQNSNSPLLTLVRVHTMYIAFHWIKILSKNNFKFQLFCISIFGILRLSSSVAMFIF